MMKYVATRVHVSLLFMATWHTLRLLENGSLNVQVLQVMLPMRYDMIHMGGSWAQRQVFNVTFIQAAIKAGNHPLALSLLAELKVYQ